jgi:hypothetical protein
VTRPRVRVGDAVRIVTEDSAGVELEGPVRLAPGRPIDVEIEGPAMSVRSAIVWSCRLVSVGPGRPTYRGYCRWS